MIAHPLCWVSCVTTKEFLKTVKYHGYKIHMTACTWASEYTLIQSCIHTIKEINMKEKICTETYPSPSIQAWNYICEWMKCGLVWWIFFYLQNTVLDRLFWAKELLCETLRILWLILHLLNKLKNVLQIWLLLFKQRMQLIGWDSTLSPDFPIRDRTPDVLLVSLMFYPPNYLVPREKPKILKKQHW